ncbi:peroxynitrite isomerase THAP4-like, partial [Ostrea edulis]|uniref:peroxynitrite isomerase THAP4-like n=1 Tax=Ostrea edulis TaxID=37623 RepID=UPI0024AFF58B
RESERCEVFFRFPKDRKKRSAWVRAINRDDWTPNEYSRVCSEHFVGSWYSDDPADENYRPTLFDYKVKPHSESKTGRNDRHSKRNLLQELNEQEERETHTLQQHHRFSLFSHSYCHIESTSEDAPPVQERPCMTCLLMMLEEKGMQCETDPLLTENESLKQQVKELQKEMEFPENCE